MKGIEQIEEIFHFQLPAFPRIHEKQGNSDEREKLDTDIHKSQPDKAYAHYQNTYVVFVKLLDAIGVILLAVRDTRENGDHASYKIVVHVYEHIKHVYADCHPQQ